VKSQRLPKANANGSIKELRDYENGIFADLRNALFRGELRR
jgi:hypothetical protein